MIKTIGMCKKPTGRFGNQVLQYLFLAELGMKYGVPIFHGEIDGSDIFLELAKTQGYSGERIKSIIGSKSIGPEELKTEGVEWLLRTIETENGRIILEPSILGYTLQTLYVDPNQLLTFSKNSSKDYISTVDFKVALHFRGTDFAGWNPEAILNTNYYIDSIKCCRELLGDNIYFMLFTDDSKLESLQDVKKYLRENGLAFYEGTPNNDVGCDLYNMSQSDILISSPSTFSIVAGLVGKKKKVIHSKQWVNKQAQSGDVFWVDLKNSSNEFYELLTLL